ncbi:MAG: diadenylate cyclase CdaA [Thermodesulfobacteriota bacterium]
MDISWIDLVDIFIVAFIIYRIMLIVKGTRAQQMLWGMAVIIVVYFLSQWGGLVTLGWVLNNFLSSLIIIIIVIFQNDIRRALAQVGKTPFFAGVDKAERVYEIEEVVKASFSLARQKIGALIVLEREIGLRDYIEVGREIDAKVSKELLASIFHTSSPIHDGAVIIQGRRITAAGCFLPLTASIHVSKALGTRHRAALGLTEGTDAVVVVASEERGEVSLVVGGMIRPALESSALREALQRLFVLPEKGNKNKKRKLIRS